MPTYVDSTPGFVRKLERLARKYPAVIDTIQEFKTQLAQDERPGSVIAGVGHDVYKARLPNRSARRGKSGGFRVVYYVVFANSVTLLTIYSKTEQPDMLPSEIRRIISELQQP